MTVQLSDRVRNARANAIEATIGVSPKLELRSGAQPANCAASETGIEVAQLDLSGVELVTLSACDTAGGDRTAGEGIVGLISGFQTAGAQSVVASLWPVDDRAARLLMEDFIGRLAERGTAAAPGAFRFSATDRFERLLRSVGSAFPDFRAISQTSAPRSARC